MFHQAKLFIEKDHVIAVPRWQRASALMVSALGDRLSRNKSMTAPDLGFDDRDDLAFGNHFIEFDQKCLDFPGCC
jgi:hypothetical protein